jgi:Tfp pilus assembly protein PilV
MTLIELLIGSMILVVIMLAVYSGFQTGVLSARGITYSLDMNQAAVQALERMSIDVRNSFPYSLKRSRFVGDGRRISFLTIADTYDGQGGRQEQYASVSYALTGDKLMRSIRLSKDSLDDGAYTQNDELLQGVNGLAFAYGYAASKGGDIQWRDVWADTARIPLLVRVTLSMKDRGGQEEFVRNIVQPVVVYE